MFLGHLNDALQFALMQPIGTYLAFPDECKHFGDKIYPNLGPIVTAISAQQIARRPNRTMARLNR